MTRRHTCCMLTIHRNRSHAHAWRAGAGNADGIRAADHRRLPQLGICCLAAQVAARRHLATQLDRALPVNLMRGHQRCPPTRQPCLRDASPQLALQLALDERAESHRLQQQQQGMPSWMPWEWPLV